MYDEFVDFVWVNFLGILSVFNCLSSRNGLITNHILWHSIFFLLLLEKVYYLQIKIITLLFPISQEHFISLASTIEFHYFKALYLTMHVYKMLLIIT